MVHLSCLSPTKENKKKTKQKHKKIISVTIVSVSLRAKGNSDRKNINFLTSAKVSSCKIINLCKSVHMWVFLKPHYIQHLLFNQ